MKAMLGVLLLILVPPIIVAAFWLYVSNVDPGSVGTPAHAGIISNGKPEQCTNFNTDVRARSQAQLMVYLDEDQVLRGTVEAQGGIGGVDIIVRGMDPQGRAFFTSPRAENYDFVFVAEIAGDYTIIFDNRYSLYTPKAVGFYYCLPR